MRMPRNICVLIAALSILPSCTTTKVYHNQPFDKKADTIAIPAGGSELNVLMKQFFKAKGFRIISSDGGSVSTPDASGKIATASEHRARYVLKLDSVREDSCITGGGMWNFSMSIIDNLNGEEVLTMGGRECGPTIMDRLPKELGYGLGGH